MNAPHFSVTVHEVGNRPSGFVGYQQIARPMGLTVAALKKHLIAAGLLINDEPTKAAIDQELAIRAALPENPTFPNPKGYRVMWARKKIVALLQSAGADENAGYGVHNGHSACNQINKAGQELSNRDDTSMAIHRYSDFLMQESHVEIITARHDAEHTNEAIKYFDTEIAPVVVLLEKRRSPSAAETSALRRLAAVRSWIDHRRNRAAPAGRATPDMLPQPH